MAIKQEILDELLKEYKNPEDLLGKNGIMHQLKRALIEKAMEGEISHHLGYEKNSPDGDNSGNSRNGKFPKTIKDKDNSCSRTCVFIKNNFTASRRYLFYIFCQQKRIITWNYFTF